MKTKAINYMCEKPIKTFLIGMTIVEASIWALAYAIASIIN